ncbi:MAG: hypothetical protein U0441_19175 [Polyangiaceae bacterium]
MYACSRAIKDQGRFPSFETLRRAQQVSGADVNTAGLLRRVSRFFQAEEHDLHAITATRCVVSEGEPTVEPIAILDRNLPEIRAPLTDVLSCLACDKSAGERFARDAHFVTPPLVGFPEDGAHKELRIAGSVALVDPEEISKRLRNESFDERFSLLFSPDDLSRFDHEAVLAGGAAGLSGMIAASAGASYPDAVLSVLQIGNHFWRSLEKTGILQDSGATAKLLKICACILADRHEEMNVDRRDLRRSAAPDSKQRTRESDGAKAWRLTITKTGAGYRLHYWDVPASAERGRTIELANVLREREPKVIPED